MCFCPAVDGGYLEWPPLVALWLADVPDPVEVLPFVVADSGTNCRTVPIWISNSHL